MATPTDDEFRTIGLPRGAVQEILKGTDPSRVKVPDRAPLQPEPAEAGELPPRRAPARAPLKPDAGPSGRDLAGRSQPDLARPLGDPDPQDYATVPPPGRGRPERADPSPLHPSPADERRPWPPLDPEPVRPRPDPSEPRGRPAPPRPRREVTPPPAAGRPIDAHDYSTAQLPGSRPRPGGGLPAQVHPLQTGLDGGVPFPDETCAVPRQAPLPPAALIPPEPREDTETPYEFPGSDPEVPSYVPPQRPAKAPGPPDRVEPQYGIDRTIGWKAPASAIAGTRLILQFFHNTIGRWSDLGEVGREGKVLTRYTFQAWDSNPDGLAEEHLRIGFDGDELFVEPFETLNGVYRKLQPNRPEELAPRTRFRIGRHVLEFRLADPPAEIVPRRSSDGEVFQSRVLVPLGFLDLIGPDCRPYLSFPLTKRGDNATRIGRAGVECDIALSGDEWVSVRHARIWWKDDRCWLEDLESTNGTFLILDGRTPVRRGSARSPATADELLVGGYKIRVIEEKV